MHIYLSCTSTSSFLWIHLQRPFAKITHTLPQRDKLFTPDQLIFATFEEGICIIRFWENNVYAWLVKNYHLSHWNKTTKHIQNICSQDTLDFLLHNYVKINLFTHLQKIIYRFNFCKTWFVRKAVCKGNGHEYLVIHTWETKSHHNEPPGSNVSVRQVTKNVRRVKIMGVLIICIILYVQHIIIKIYTEKVKDTWLNILSIFKHWDLTSNTALRQTFL